LELIGLFRRTDRVATILQKAVPVVWLFLFEPRVAVTVSKTRVTSTIDKHQRK